jgi:hypothetical protein
MNAEYDAVCAELMALWQARDSAEFQAAFARLEVLAHGGHLQAAQYVAEILTLSGPLHDAEAAYRWYCILLSQCPSGDSRRKPLRELASEIGPERARQLEAEAASWLLEHGLP